MADKAVKIARVLEVPPDWLFDDDAGWPPPETGSKSMGDFELIEELARRRRLVIQDAQAIARRFTDPSKLQRLEDIAARAWHGGYNRLDPQKQNELRAGQFDLQRLYFLEQQLKLLDPTKSPGAEPLSWLDTILEKCPNLSAQVRGMPDSNADGLLSRYTFGRLVPVAFPDGGVITRQQYVELGAILQWHFTPLVEDPENGPPNEKPILVYRGQQPPERFREFVRFGTEQPQAFAFRLRDDAWAPDYPKGAIVVCEPSEPTVLRQTPFIVVFENTGKVALFQVTPDKMFDSPWKERKLKRGEKAKFYKIIAGPFRAGDDDPTASDVWQRSKK